MAAPIGPTVSLPESANVEGKGPFQLFSGGTVNESTYECHNIILENLFGNGSYNAPPSGWTLSEAIPNISVFTRTTPGAGATATAVLENIEYTSDIYGNTALTVIPIGNDFELSDSTATIDGNSLAFPNGPVEHLCNAMYDLGNISFVTSRSGPGTRGVVQYLSASDTYTQVIPYEVSTTMTAIASANSTSVAVVGDFNGTTAIQVHTGIGGTHANTNEFENLLTDTRLTSFNSSTYVGTASLSGDLIAYQIVMSPTTSSFGNLQGSSVPLLDPVVMYPVAEFLEPAKVYFFTDAGAKVYSVSAAAGVITMPADITSDNDMTMPAGETIVKVFPPSTLLNDIIGVGSDNRIYTANSAGPTEWRDDFGNLPSMGTIQSVADLNLARNHYVIVDEDGGIFRLIRREGSVYEIPMNDNTTAVTVSAVSLAPSSMLVGQLEDGNAQFGVYVDGFSDSTTRNFLDPGFVTPTPTVTATPIPTPEASSDGIPWWVWLAVVLAALLIIIVTTVVVIKKKKRLR